MQITVKRKLWIFSAFMPVRLKFNGKSVGSLYGSQEMTIPITESEGKLKYFQPVGRNNQIRVEKGDVIEVEETIPGKILSVLFVALMIYLLTKALGILDFTSFANYEALILSEQIVFGVILVVALIAFFLKRYKLVLVNR